MKLYFLFLPISILLLASCGSETTRRAAQTQTQPVKVRTAAVSTEEWPASYEATGTVRARTTTTISSKSDGLRAAGERTSRGPCPRRPAFDHLEVRDWM